MNILLVCACGSSTSVVLQKMKENLTEDEPWTIEAKSLSEDVYKRQGVFSGNLEQ